MSFEDFLNQSGALERFTEGAADGYGHKPKTWAPLASAVPCRLSGLSKGQEFKVGSETVLSTHVLFLEPRDVTERDRWVLEGRTYNILLVRPIREVSGVHHLELDLELVRP